MFEPTSPLSSDADAEFLGWQETFYGELVPLFIITVAGHPSYHSTVGETTLRRLHLRIPQIPLHHVHTKAGLYHHPHSGSSPTVSIAKEKVVTWGNSRQR